MPLTAPTCTPRSTGLFQHSARYCQPDQGIAVRGEQKSLIECVVGTLARRQARTGQVTSTQAPDLQCEPSQLQDMQAA